MSMVLKRQNRHEYYLNFGFSFELKQNIFYAAMYSNYAF